MQPAASRPWFETVVLLDLHVASALNFNSLCLQVLTGWVSSIASSVCSELLFGSIACLLFVGLRAWFDNLLS